MITVRLGEEHVAEFAEKGKEISANLSEIRGILENINYCVNELIRFNITK